MPEYILEENSTGARWIPVDDPRRRWRLALRLIVTAAAAIAFFI
jgi:hypothetical protein